MTKNLYTMPSVQVTEMSMVQTLCASTGTPLSPEMIDPEATTSEQL